MSLKGEGFNPLAAVPFQPCMSTFCRFHLCVRPLARIAKPILLARSPAFIVNSLQSSIELIPRKTARYRTRCVQTFTGEHKL